MCSRNSIMLPGCSCFTHYSKAGNIQICACSIIVWGEGMELGEGELPPVLYPQLDESCMHIRKCPYFSHCLHPIDLICFHILFQIHSHDCGFQMLIIITDSS